MAHFTQSLSVPKILAVPSQQTHLSCHGEVGRVLQSLPKGSVSLLCRAAYLLTSNNPTPHPGRAVPGQGSR
jgi:hypothetical protein